MGLTRLRMTSVLCEILRKLALKLLSCPILVLISKKITLNTSRKKIIKMHTSGYMHLFFIKTYTDKYF